MSLLEGKGVLPYFQSMPKRSTALKITSKGQVTLRRQVLDHIGVGPGDKVMVDLLPNGRIEVRAAPRGSIQAFFGSIHYDGPPLSLDEIKDAIEAGWAGER